MLIQLFLRVLICYCCFSVFNYVYVNLIFIRRVCSSFIFFCLIYLPVRVLSLNCQQKGKHSKKPHHFLYISCERFSFRVGTQCSTQWYICDWYRSSDTRYTLPVTSQYPIRGSTLWKLIYFNLHYCLNIVRVWSIWANWKHAMAINSYMHTISSQTHDESVPFGDSYRPVLSENNCKEKMFTESILWYS